MLDAQPRTLALLAVAFACTPQTSADTTIKGTTSAPAGSETTTPTGDSGEVAALAIDAVEPALVDPDGGSQLLVHGTGFEPGMVCRIAGLSLFWVARTPYSPPPYGWVESYNPASTVIGGSYPPTASAGFTDGALSYVNRSDTPDAEQNPIWDVVHVGADLQGAANGVHAVGLVHAPDGRLTALIDGAASDAGLTDFGAGRVWSRIGGGLDGPGEGPNNRFAGTLGAVVVVPDVVDAEDVARLHAWARGRFGAP